MEKLFFMSSWAMSTLEGLLAFFLKEKDCWYNSVCFLCILQEIGLLFAREGAKVLQFLWLCQQLPQAKEVCLIGQLRKLLLVVSPNLM
jgi:hypothetical protein